MKRTFYCMALILMLSISVSSNAFDLTQKDKHGDKLSEAPCNPNTVIDFRLSSSSTITCTAAGCTVVIYFSYSRLTPLIARFDFWTWAEKRKLILLMEHTLKFTRSQRGREQDHMKLD